MSDSQEITDPTLIAYFADLVPEEGEDRQREENNQYEETGADRL